MAENKKSFILYADQQGLFNQLPDEIAGKLIKHIFQYITDQNPETEDLLLKIAFEPIKQQLKRDLKDWEQTRQKRSDAGKAGGIKSGESRRNEANVHFASKNEANEAVNVNVTVNDTVINNKENKMPLAEEIKELPEIKIQAAIQLLKITKQKDVSPAQIIGLWDVFKIQNLTGKNFYASVDKIYSHFIHWVKTQNFENGTSKTNNRGYQKLSPSAERERLRQERDR